jgi:hypothetical protein
MRWYERPHITAVPTEDGENLQLRGLLDNVGRTDENEIPSVAPSDKRPKLAFRVTLGEDSREVELSLS